MDLATILRYCKTAIFDKVDYIDIEPALAQNQVINNVALFCLIENISVMNNLQGLLVFITK